jgi:hypothetical protein
MKRKLSQELAKKVSGNMLEKSGEAYARMMSGNAKFRIGLTM